ncbi:CPBP family intramembrane glutamic endopeptidase [Agromyces sp. MMS24-K17]|uniref:CPBP family intramembrane glutamic endopeptidase n=1 Tax=Agromyces sp. MMS24-K17 TaxID=3372850 RepID=UPI0037547C0E
MASSPGSTGSAVARGDHASARRRFADAAAGLFAAIVLMLGWQWVTRTWIVDPAVQLAGAYLAVWAPLVAATAIAVRRHGARLGLRFRWLDVLWGLGAGLLARGAVTLIEAAATGGAGLVTIDPGPTRWLTLLIVPVVLAPVIEETFFRGLLQPVIRDRATVAGAGRRAATVIGIVASALCFALLHALDATSPTAALIVSAGAAVIGLACGILAATTGRLGGAIIAHATYNATLLALLG